MIEMKAGRILVKAGWVIALVLGIVVGSVASPTRFAEDLMIKLGDEGGVSRAEMVFNLIKHNGNGARMLADGLDDLIVARYGESIGIASTPEEIEAEMATWSVARRAGLEEYFEPALLKQIVGRQLVRQSVLDRVAQDVIAENGVTVEDGELMAFFVNEYAPANTLPEKARFSIIQLKSAEFARQVLGKYEGGEDFGELARTYSEHKQSAANNGDMLEPYDLTSAPKSMFPMVQAALRQDIGQAGIVQAADSFFIVRTDMKFDRVEPRFADHRAELETMLMQRKAAPLIRAKFKQIVEDSTWELNCSIFSREEIQQFRPMVKLAGIE